MACPWNQRAGPRGRETAPCFTTHRSASCQAVNPPDALEEAGTVHGQTPHCQRTCPGPFLGLHELEVHLGCKLPPQGSTGGSAQTQAYRPVQRPCAPSLIPSSIQWAGVYPVQGNGEKSPSFVLTAPLRSALLSYQICGSAHRPWTPIVSICIQT